MRNAIAGLSAALLLGVSGCALSADPVASVGTDESIVTGSVTAKSPFGVEKADAEIIKTTVASAEEKPVTTPLAWSNPQTGSSGAIVAIDQFMGKHGQTCRGFKTTVDTFMGIAFYNGEACQISPGEWVLSWFQSSD